MRSVKNYLSCLLLFSSLSLYADDSKLLDAWTRDLKTPLQIYEYNQKNIKYRHDDEKIDFRGDGHPGTNWMQSPLETIRKKKGDCEDYANLSSYVLRKNGYRSIVLAVWSKNLKKAHAVCVYIDKDGFGVIDNNEYGIKPENIYRSLYSIGREIYKKWDKMEIQEEYKEGQENYKTVARITNDKIPEIEFYNSGFPLVFR